MDIVAMLLWFSVMVIMMIINFIGYFKVPFLQIISMMFFLTVFSIILATLWYFGGYALLVGLGAIGLTVVIFMSFALGVKWSHKLMVTGAELAINSQAKNDEYDAVKIKALSELTREAIKAKQEALPAPQAGYPALPPFNAIDGTFTIAGLDKNEGIEQ